MIRQDYGPATVCFSHCQFMSAGLVKHSFQSPCVKQNENLQVAMESKSQ